LDSGTPAVITAKPRDGLVQQPDVVVAPVPVLAAAPPPVPVMVAAGVPVLAPAPASAEVTQEPEAPIQLAVEAGHMEEDDAPTLGALEVPTKVAARNMGGAEIHTPARTVAQAPSESSHNPSQVLMPPPPVPLMPHHINGAPTQMPVHVSQMAMANGLAFGGGMPVSGPLPFHPNQMVNMNAAAAMYLYPQHLIAQPLYAPPHFTAQHQMYKMGMVPQQFMAPPLPNRMPALYEQRGSTGYGMMGGGIKKQNPVNYFRETATPPACFTTPQKNNKLLTVRSAATLNIPPVGSQQIEFETCQTAMARQVSGRFEITSNGGRGESEE
uniref:PAM2 domain-containing protein n=1 Tax=Toxocara canis TaxID=6265 RepID=A0A183V3K8_TOXCA